MHQPIPWVRSLALAASLGLVAPAAMSACTVSATPLHLGPLLPLGGGTQSTGFATVTVSCVNLLFQTSYTVGIGRSPGAPDTSMRYLRNPLGGPALAYNLYLDANHTRIWGDGVATPGASGSMSALLSAQRQHTIYGRVAAGQTRVRPGTFTDQLLVTLTYNP